MLKYLKYNAIVGKTFKNSEKVNEALKVYVIQKRLLLHMITLIYKKRIIKLTNIF